MPRKKKEVAEETEVKKTKKEKVTKTQEDQIDELLPKIQCFNENKKLICANLQWETHKCTAKAIAPGRLATVRLGKKRRCAMYDETAFTV